jgi:hypothetical protein
MEIHSLCEFHLRNRLATGIQMVSLQCFPCENYLKVEDVIALECLASNDYGGAIFLII